MTTSSITTADIAGSLRHNIDFWRRLAATTPDHDGHLAGIITALDQCHRKTAGTPRAYPPPYLIASTGRSGSGYIAAVLTAAGIRCGHEGFWTANPKPDLTLLVDSSWWAIPDLPTYLGRVLHQTRHPLAVIASHAAVWDQNGIYWARKQATFREATGNLLIDAAAVYVDANTAIEDADPDLRWRVEDLTTTTLIAIASIIGEDLDQTRALNALKSVPRNVNPHRPPDHPDLSWRELRRAIPAGLYRELEEISERYGYDE